jgi:2-keto-3-deoxy-L-rhamnonate aldolase RhmA
MANAAKEKLKRDELVLCLAVNQMRSVDVALIAKACGFDALFVDLEHGPTSLESASLVCLAAKLAGVTPIARIASHLGHDMARVLDSGAQGLMVPHIDTAEEARAIVDYCRFPPKGHRSASGAGPMLAYAGLPQAEVSRILNDELLLFAMVETPKGLENVGAIAAVDGIDGIHVGSLDLSTEMGLPGDYRHPRMRAAFEKIAAACKANGKAMGVGGARGDRQLQDELIGLGARYLTTGSDVSYLMAAARAEVAELRAAHGVGRAG